MAVLQQELAHQAANADTDEDDVSWETGTADSHAAGESREIVHTEVVEGQKYSRSFRSLGRTARSTAWK